MHDKKWSRDWSKFEWDDVKGKLDEAETQKVGEKRKLILA